MNHFEKNKNSKSTTMGRSKKNIEVLVENYMVRKTKGRVLGWMSGWMDGGMDEGMRGWMDCRDEWMRGWMDCRDEWIGG